MCRRTDLLMHHLKRRVLPGRRDDLFRKVIAARPVEPSAAHDEMPSRSPAYCVFSRELRAAVDTERIRCIAGSVRRGLSTIEYEIRADVHHGNILRSSLCRNNARSLLVHEKRAFLVILSSFHIRVRRRVHNELRPRILNRRANIVPRTHVRFREIAAHHLAHLAEHDHEVFPKLPLATQY